MCSPRYVQPLRHAPAPLRFKVPENGLKSQNGVPVQKLSKPGWETARETHGNGYELFDRRVEHSQ